MQDLNTEITALRARVDALEAQQAIRELVTTYAVACDQHDMPTLADLFTEDAEFASPSGAMRAIGRDAIAEMFVGLFKVRGPAFHWTHDVIVTTDPDAPDTASGVVYSHAETTPNGVVSLAAMRYHDSYRREEGKWRFARREISFLYYVPAAEYIEGLNQSLRVHTAGTGARVAADYPEQLECWQDFERRYGG